MNLPVTLKRLIGAIVISFLYASPSANAAASIVVPGCAPIHPQTCVKWKKQKGGGWSVQNDCGASVSVTLEKNRSSTPILSPGQVWPVEIKPAQYLVFDSGEYEKWVKSIPKRSWGNFHAEVGFPCEDKLLLAQQSGRENSNNGDQSGGAASNCPTEAFDDRGYTKAKREGDAIQFYGKYVTDNDWHPGYRGMLSDKGLEHLYCVENDSSFDKQLCKMFQCSKNSSTTASGSRSSGEKSNHSSSGQIESCPPTLPPSCVTWSLYDQQLQWWNLTNNCGRDVSVTFKSEGALENTQTFGNGESYRAKWRGKNPPRQVVWDAAKGFGFYRNKPAGAALKCQASLPL